MTIGLDDGLFADKDLSRTPQKSMQARLSIEILRGGDKSRFIRTSRGKFFLRDLMSANIAPDIITSNEYTAIRRAPVPSTEQVLVIHRDAYSDIFNFQGIDTQYKRLIERIISSRALSYMPRTDAELNPDYKQFVTYTIIQRRDRVLAFKRGQYNRAASFLRGARCIGFGGHVTEEDHTLFTLTDAGIRANAAREISEEIKFRNSRPAISPNDIDFLGFLNDDSSDVGVRHVGVVLRYWVPDSPDWDHPLRGEASISQLRWMKTAGEEIDLLDFEYWSQLALRHFFPAFLTNRPSYKILKQSVFHEPHLLCVTGSIGSGKSITTKRLCKNAHYEQVNTGQLVARLIGVPPVPETPRAEFQEMAYSFITTPNGPTKLAEEIAGAVEEIDSSRVIIDGVRQLETLEKLKEITGRKVATIFVHTPPDIAYKMYIAREHSTSDMSLSDFMTIYNAPVENEVRFMIQEADAVIYNWFGLEEYELVIDRLLGELGMLPRAA